MDFSVCHQTCLDAEQAIVPPNRLYGGEMLVAGTREDHTRQGKRGSVWLLWQQNTPLSRESTMPHRSWEHMQLLKLPLKSGTWAAAEGEFPHDSEL